MKNYVKSTLWLTVIGMLAACSEQVDTSARYVYKYDSALSYLEKHEQYSQYVELLKATPVSPVSDTKVAQLISTRGHYTVFAPTNEAIDTFLTTLCFEEPELLTAPSWDAFVSERKRDSIRHVVVHNSIIDSGDNEEAFLTYDFPIESGNELPLNNMNERKLSVRYYRDTIFINNTCPISPVQQDIIVTNGVIHQMDASLPPRISPHLNTCSIC